MISFIINHECKRTFTSIKNSCDIKNIVWMVFEWKSSRFWHMWWWMHFFDKFVEHLPQNKPYGKKLKKAWFLLVKIAPLKKLATYFKSEDICEIFQQMFLLWPNKYVTERKLDTPLWKVILSRIHFPKNHASRYVQHFQVKIAYCREIMWQVTNCIIS